MNIAEIYNEYNNLNNMLVIYVEDLAKKEFEGEDEETVKKDLQVEIDSVYGKGHTPLFKDVVEAIKENRKPYVSGEDAIVPLSIILAAYKSRKTGMPVNFPFTDFSSSDMKK